MRIEFEYSLSVEFASVLFTLENLKFYKDKNYQVHLPRLPKDLVQRIVGHKTGKFDYFVLLEILSKEFDKNKKSYRKVKNNLQTHWRNVERRGIYKKIEKLTGNKLPDKTTCFLTIWGSGGSEIPPDKIVIRVFTPGTYKRTLSKQIGYERYTNRVGFELVELALHNLQKKYKIPQEKYIRIVDNILSDTKCFYSSMNLRGDWGIDDTYKKYKGNIKELFNILL